MNGNEQRPSGQSKAIRLAFYQPGDYSTFSLLREAYQDQLTALAGDSVSFEFQPQLSYYAGWNRDSSRALAAQIVANPKIDIVVAFGPWGIEDLLIAGFKKPIVALARPFPRQDGLLDPAGRPRASQLTVSYDPDKLKRELALMLDLLRPKSIGFLFFEADSSSLLIREAESLLTGSGVAVAFPEGVLENNSGTFAFFRAYGLLKSKTDIVYTGPLYGLADGLRGQYLQQVRNDKKALVSAENRFPVEQGAMLSFAGHTIIAPARVAAWKTIKIVQGATPADLPTIYPEQLSPAVNLTATRMLRVDLPLQFLAQAEQINEQPTEDDPKITLGELIESASRLSPTVSMQQASIARALQMQSGAQSSGAPTVSLDGSIGWIDKNAVINSGDRLSNDRSRISLTVSQPLFRADWLSRFSKSDVNEESSSIGRQFQLAVALAYLDLVKARSFEKVSQQIGLVVDRLSESARAASLLDKNDDTDWIRMRVELLRVGIDRANARTAIERAEATLAAVCADPRLRTAVVDEAAASSEAIAREYSGYRSLIGSQAARSLAETKLIDRAVANSLVLQQGTGSSAGVKKSSWAWSIIPDIDLNASASLFDSLQATPSFAPKKSGWMADLTFTLPIGRRPATSQSFGDSFAANQKLLQRDQERIRLSQEVQMLLAEIEGHLASAPNRSQSIELSLTHIQLIMTEYDAGERPLSDLLDAVSSLARSRTEELDDRFALLAASLRLQTLALPKDQPLSLSLRAVLQ